MRDLKPYMDKLMELSYEEKIQMSEWLHKEIELEMGDAVKAKAQKVGEQLSSFLDKAAATTKSAGNSLLDSFRDATSGEPKK